MAYRKLSTHRWCKSSDYYQKVSVKPQLSVFHWSVMINNNYFYWIANKNFLNSIQFFHQMGIWCINMPGLIICQQKQLTKRRSSVTEEGSPRTSGRRTWSNMSILLFSKNVFCMLKLYLNVKLNIPPVYDMWYWHHMHYLLLYHPDSSFWLSIRRWNMASWIYYSRASRVGWNIDVNW